MTGLIFTLLLGTAHAVEFDGVQVPDTASVGGQNLVLNGVGLREKYFLDIYVGAAYLPAKSTDAKKIISDDVPKRIEMTFIYSKVTKDQLAGAYDEDLPHVPNHEAVAPKFETLKGYLSDVVAGDKITYDYVPGTGVSVTVKGVNKGTIAGTDFMQALWTIYFGDHPPTENLKTGMLGG